MKELTLDDLRKRPARRIQKVLIPDLGGYLHLRSLYGDELEGWEESRIERKGANARVNAENTRASLLVLVLCSADGRALDFTEEDVKALAGQDGRALNQLFEVACEMNGLRQSDLEALNRPNSVTTPAVSSGSA